MSRTRRQSVVIAILRLVITVLFMVTLRAHAQTAKAAFSAPSFEVASIRPSKAGTDAPGVFRFLSDGSLRVENMPLRDVIRAAYRLRSYQMPDWPEWTAKECFDIQAKADGKASEETRFLVWRQSR